MDAATFCQSHPLYEIKYSLLFLVDKFRAESRPTIDSSRVTPDTVLFLSRDETLNTIRDRIRSHDVITVDMYKEFFDSVPSALDASRQSAEHSIGGLEFQHGDNNSEKASNSSPCYSVQKKYGPKWNVIKEEIRNRDHICRVCGKDEDDTYRESKLQVHHIMPADEFERERGDRDFKSMNDRQNLILLCPSCHGKFEGQWKWCTPDEFAEKAINSKQNRQRCIDNSAYDFSNNLNEE